MPRERRGRERWALSAVLAVAFVLRAVHFFDVAPAPFSTAPVIDARQFQQMAEEIASGRLIGETAYEKGPLYPHLLAVVYAVFGPRIPVALALQLAVGVLGCYLVFALGRALFGVAEGLVAAAWAAVYRPFIFFEGQLLAAWLAALLTTSFLIVLWRATRSRGSSVHAFGAGLLLALAIATRGNLLLAIPFALLWLAWLARRERTHRPARLAGLFLLGCLVPISATVLHNFLASGEFVPVTSTAGINLYTGNGEEADGYSAIPVHSAWESAMDEARAAGASSPAEHNAYWVRRTLEHAGAHPGALAGILFKKVILFWDAFEYPNNLSFAFYARISRVLRWPLPAFGLLAPVALVALWIRRRDPGDPVPYLALFLGLYGLSVILFFACDRYRLPAIPALLCLAGAGLVRLYRDLRAGPRARTAWVLAPLALAGLFVNVDWYGARPAHLGRDFLALGDAYRYQGRLPAAMRAYRRAISENPADPDPHAQLGQCLYRTGQRGAAEASLREAARLDAGYALPRSLLARLLFEERRFDEATGHLLDLIELYPGQAEPRVLLGMCHERLGRLDDAIREYRLAVESAPGSPAAGEARARLAALGPRAGP